ncbi:hypothetical protein BVY03_00535 [bacterium K02(2017)]|nr:hypothetical protein BVY03_00535 [bacterium K02(2017)]
MDNQVNESTLENSNQISRHDVKHLIFDLASERYGIPLSIVKEVISLSEIAPIPHVPKYLIGLINLRGSIITIIDLRMKLGLTSNEYIPKKTSIIITDIDNLTIGFVVDEVADVVKIKSKQVDNQISVQSKTSREYISGVAKMGDKKLALLLDIGKVLATSDLDIIRKVK